jgi:foldase protein PrsA
VSKALRFTAALGAVLFVSVALVACGGGIPGGSVVKINGAATITNTTFDHWMGVAASSSAQGEKATLPEPPAYKACIAHLKSTEGKPEKGQKAPAESTLKTECAQQYKSLQQEVLGFLISSSWVLGEASAMNVKVSDEEVHKQFEKIKSEEFPKASEFEKFLSSSGQTISDLLLRVKLNMLSQKIQQKVVKKKPTITHADVVKYYEENKTRYGSPEKRNIEIILTKTEAQSLKAKKEIESGKSFATVAKAVSIDPTSKAKGGYLPEVIKGEEEKELDEAVFAAKANVLGGPIKTEFGYYLYEVKSTIAGSQQPLSKVESTIKTSLAQQAQQKALTAFIKSFKTRWKNKTECRSEYLVADCKGYKAPKTKGAKAKSAGESEGTSESTAE